jgi:hypothetical protein
MPFERASAALGAWPVRTLSPRQTACHHAARPRRSLPAIAGSASVWPLAGEWRWRAVQTTANGQPALGFYAWNAQDGGYRPFALNVLGLRGREISEVTAFIARSAEPRDRRVFERYPDEPVHAGKLGDVFERFGLPALLGV